MSSSYLLSPLELVDMRVKGGAGDDVTGEVLGRGEEENEKRTNSKWIYLSFRFIS